VVATNRLHPFWLWLKNSEPPRTQEWAAAMLGISRVHLTAVLAGRMVPSRELYSDMSRLSRGAVKVRELVAFKRPSERPRRKAPKPRAAKRPDLAAETGGNGRPEKLHS
jgi:hypothetical protein